MSTSTDQHQLVSIAGVDNQPVGVICVKCGRVSWRDQDAENCGERDEQIIRDIGEWCSNDRKELTREFIRVFSQSMRLASLNNWAAECHKLAVARGKYRRWNALIGRNAIRSELDEWYAEASLAEAHPNATAYHEEEYGDLLHAVLSIGHQMGYDIDATLAGAMERNRKRAREGA